MSVRRPRLVFPESEQRTDAKWIDHLGVVYGQERTLLTLLTTVGSIGGSLVAGIALNLPDFNVCSAGAPAEDGCLEPWQAALIPFGPLIILQFLLYMYLNAQIMGKYARELERAISTPLPSETAPAAASSPAGAAQDEDGTGADATRNPELRLPSLARVLGALYGGESRGLRVFQVFFLILGIVVVGSSLATIVAVLISLPPSATQVVAIAIYAVVIAVTVAAYLRGISHSAFDRICAEALVRDERKRQADVPGLSVREFISYVLLPRPASLAKMIDGGVAIGLVYLLAAGLDTLTVPDPARLGWAVAGLVAYEAILYQTRYLLNYLRDDPQAIGQLTPESDRRNSPHRITSSRGELGEGQRIAALAIAGARLGLFVGVFTALPVVDIRQTLVILGAFLVVYYAYEIPRDRWRAARRPARGAVWQEARPALSVVTLAAVGLGYGLRAYVVVVLLLPEMLWTAPAVALLLAFYFGGCASVTAGWAVEATGVIGNDTRRRTIPATLLDPSVARKGYLAWAAHRANLLKAGARYKKPVAVLKDVTPLLIEHQFYLTPWRIFGALGVGSALAIQPWSGVPAGRAVMAGAMTVVAMVIVVLFGGARTLAIYRRRTTPTAPAWHLLLALAVAVGALAVVVGWQAGSLATVPASIVTVVFVLHSKLGSAEGSSLNRLVQGAENARRWVFETVPSWAGIALVGLLGVLVGRPVRELLVSPRRRNGAAPE